MSARSAILIAPLLLTPVAGILAAQDTMGNMHHEHASAPLSTSLTVTGAGQTLIFSITQLQALPQTTVSVFNAHSKVEETYAGPLVSDVLAKAGVVLTEATQHSILDSYVTATGTDGYFVVFSGAELQPGLHKVQAIIALSRNGKSLGENGAFQLVDSLEVKPARWVRNLQTLTIKPVANHP